MNKIKLVKYCLVFEDAVETYPFKDKTYNEYAIVRHNSNRKWFAVIFYLEGKLYINLKCNPLDASLLREEYSFITPAWHMNKAHWNKVDVSKCPIDLLNNMIKVSFELTASKPKSVKSVV